VPTNLSSVRWQNFIAVIVLAFAISASAESAKIIKVLPQFLDLKGRSSISPSLYDRDAYQEQLRTTKTNRTALQFNVNWKVHGHEALIIRVEAKGMKGKEPTSKVLEQTLKPGVFSKWTGVTIAGTNYESFGELVSWRVTLLNSTNVVAEQKSFLW
jgi:hypothetical protein